MRSLAIAVIVAWSSLAHAAPDPFKKFVASLESGTPDATWLGSCQVLVTPSGQLRRPCTLALTDLVGSQAGIKLVVTRNRRQDFPQSTMGYREALVEARAGSKLVATFHVLEIEHCCGNPDAPDAGHPRAVHWSQLAADKDVTAAARAGTLVTPPAVKDAIARSTQTGQSKSDDEALFEDLARLKGSAKYQQDLAAVTSDGAVVFGSGPGQRYTGKPGQRTISRWKLDLEQQGGVDVTGGNMIGVAVTKFVATTREKAPVSIPYVAFVVYTQFLTGGGSMGSRPALVKFAVAR